MRACSAASPFLLPLSWRRDPHGTAGGAAGWFGARHLMPSHNATFAINRLHGAALTVRAQPAQAGLVDLEGLSPANAALVCILLAEVNAHLPEAADSKADAIERGLVP